MSYQPKDVHFNEFHYYLVLFCLKKKDRYYLYQGKLSLACRKHNFLNLRSRVKRFRQWAYKFQLKLNQSCPGIVLFAYIYVSCIKLKTPSQAYNKTELYGSLILSMFQGIKNCFKIDIKM